MQTATAPASLAGRREWTGLFVLGDTFVMSDETTQSQSTYVTPEPMARAAKWGLDLPRTTVSITHKAMWGLSTVRGTFTAVRGEGEVLQDGTGAGTLIIDASSVDTANAKRDTHLRSADFFDVEHHRDITFVARRVQPEGDGTAEVTGELTVAGTTRPLAFRARITESSERAVSLAAEVRVDRAEFGMTWNNLGMVIGKTTVNVKACFIRLPSGTVN
jgi:polyisoprenoid-binding protein YceI